MNSLALANSCPVDHWIIRWGRSEWWQSKWRNWYFSEGKACWVVSELGNLENEHWVSYKSNLWQEKGWKWNAPSFSINARTPISEQKPGPPVNADTVACMSGLIQQLSLTCTWCWRRRRNGPATTSALVHQSRCKQPPRGFLVNTGAGASPSHLALSTVASPPQGRTPSASFARRVISLIAREDAGNGLSSAERWQRLLGPKECLNSVPATWRLSATCC